MLRITNSVLQSGRCRTNLTGQNASDCNSDFSVKFGCQCVRYARSARFVSDVIAFVHLFLLKCY
jgi:hypothetical protein